MPQELSEKTRSQIVHCQQKLLSVKKKGTANHATTDKVLVIKYMDNNVVTIASNFGSPEIGQTSRYSREKKGYVSHPYPVAVKNYNSYMGGVDQLDLWEANYRSRMHQKKCWWPVFLYFFDTTVVNAWLLWRKTMGNIPLLEFCRSLAVTILKSYRSASAQEMRALPV